MSSQIDKETFRRALEELGHDTSKWSGQKLALADMATQYELSESTIVDAIESQLIDAHYDYTRDTVWVDALDAAHFFFCLRHQANLFPDAS